MTQTPTLLAVLLDRRGLGRYGSFRPAYEKAARAIDSRLSHSAPSRAQFYRWTTGGLRSLPYTDHCRVLEHMLTGYTAAQLLEPCPDRASTRACSQRRYARAGLSDQYELSCLFLDPAGEAISAPEREEEYQSGFLSSLTRLNIDLLARLRDRLPAHAQDRLKIAVYDETIRFNILIAEGRACVVQPYLPHARGVDSPTLLIRPDTEPGSLFPVFEHVWDALAKRSTPL